uniref:Uncharacterized protein n=1 Tax=Palpitomonas bilix TaxID=652834 RepID=A0A7S3DLQ3_9EUKA
MRYTEEGRTSCARGMRNRDRGTPGREAAQMELSVGRCKPSKHDCVALSIPAVHTGHGGGREGKGEGDVWFVPVPARVSKWTFRWRAAPAMAKCWRICAASFLVLACSRWDRASLSRLAWLEK